jgi:hypothetical protein
MRLDFINCSYKSSDLLITISLLSLLSLLLIFLSKAQIRSPSLIKYGPSNRFSFLFKPVANLLFLPD